MKTPSCFRGILVLVCVVLGLSPNFLWAKNELENERVQIFLNEESLVEKEQYTLGEIAKLDGLNSELIERLGQTVIGRSPLPGGSMLVSKPLILARLRPLIPEQQVAFPAAEQTNVKRVAMRIAGEEIDQVVLDYLQQQMQGTEIKPKLMAKSRDLFLPRGELSYEVKDPENNKKEGGYRTYEVAFSINGQLAKAVPVRVYLKVYKDVYVAKNTIHSEQVIQETDLQKIRKNIDRLPSNYVTDPNELVGKLAKRTIGANEVMVEHVAESQPVINSGDHLLIVYETPSLKVTAQGVALSKGRLGERISVRNLNSKTVLQAEVKDKELVQVN